MSLSYFGGPGARRASLALAIGLLTPGLSHAGIFAAEVKNYAPGNAAANFQNAQAARGPISGDSGFGGVNPFNPPFASDQIVIVGAGGSLSLRLDAPVPAAGGRIGVFVNNGVVDVTADGSGKAGSPATTFSSLPQALVSVSSDNQTYIPLGTGPVTFDNPTNAWLDSPISGYFQSPGTRPADQGKPFLGRLTDFSGETYSQFLTRLNGSAGGTWLDLSAVPLNQVAYVKFDVPTGANYRMVVDSVSAVPDPTGAGALLLAGGLLVRNRRRTR